MSDLIIKHDELTAEEFIYMWESVWGEGPSLEQTKLAMDNTLFRVSIFDGERIVAMARVIGDMGFVTISKMLLCCLNIREKELAGNRL